jgi:hypothetical protein
MITHTPHRVRALPYIDRFQGSKNSGWKTGGLARSKISKADPLRVPLSPRLGWSPMRSTSELVPTVLCSYTLRLVNAWYAMRNTAAPMTATTTL